uniref:Uncharacterized protein n=1 Tax=Haptolina ericina TaxID=156174 RepID=A0A7S3ARB3_9EUKA
MAEAALHPSVGDALLADDDVVELMQHPKLASAIQQLKEEPSAYGRLVKEDAELESLFKRLQVAMAAKEKEVGVGANGADDAPPLQEADEAECEAARAEGAALFEAGDYTRACVRYERATLLRPAEHTHWSNLAVARLRAGEPAAAAEAARRCIKLNPRFAKGHLRLGEALHATGEHGAAIEAFELGLLRAEGGVRLALTKGLQRATKAAKEAKKQSPPSAHGNPASAGAPSVVATPEAAAAVATTGSSRTRSLEALPGVAEERALAHQTAALRSATGLAMAQYAEQAKLQTQAAAERAAGRARQAATLATATGGEQRMSDPSFPGRMEKRSGEVATGRALRQIQVVEESDESDEEAGQPSGDSTLERPAAADEGCALEGESTAQAAPSALLLSNDLIFDLA